MGAPEERVRRARWRLLGNVRALGERAMVAFALAWLLLLILEWTVGLNRAGQHAVFAIWVLFAADFAVEFSIAPRKRVYLAHHWLTALSLALPALRALRMFRFLRVLRTARAVRSLSLLRVLSSMNRGMSAIRNTMRRRGIGYVVALTALVTFSGAAGMAVFENPASLPEGGGLSGYGEALWWTAMLMTTLGADYSPRTLEGRILAFVLATYALAIFGYITASIASHFIGVDAGIGQARDSE